MSLDITKSDVLNRWVGPNKPSSENNPTFSAIFEDAVDLIYSKVPNIEQLVSQGSTTLSTVKQVLTAVIVRYYNVGQEYRSSFSETAGPFNQSGSYAQNQGQGLMQLTPNEILALTGSNVSGSSASISRTGSIRPNTFFGDCTISKDGWMNIRTETLR